MLENNYWSLAISDKEAADILYNNGMYNASIVHAQQACEKVFKSVIIDFDLIDCENDPLLRTHNLSKLLRFIIQNLNIQCSLSQDTMGWLSGMYFYARYPGDDFIVVEAMEAQRALNKMDEVINFAERLYNS